MNEERLRVLKMLQAGDISAEQAAQLLQALGEADLPGETETRAERQLPDTETPNLAFWWIYPTTVGAVVMAIGAPLVALGLTGRVAAFWAVCCGWLPLLAGVVVLSLGVWSRNARWFHLRIRNNRTGRHTFALSLPLPLTLTAWLLRVARLFVPQLRDTGLDEAILGLKDGLREQDHEPLYIDVRDGEDGEQVLIWFGKS